jgi:ketosteroid isomerase-like protein
LIVTIGLLFGYSAYRVVLDIRDRQRISTVGPECVALLDAQVVAWNRGDLDGFMAGYWESDDLRFYAENTIATGYQPLRERYFQRYKAEGKEMGHLTFWDIEVVTASWEAAVVRGHWKVEKSTEAPQGLFTLVLRRYPQGWRIVHDHTSAEAKK